MRTVLRAKESASLIPRSLMFVSYFLFILYMSIPIYTVYLRAALVMSSCLLLGLSWLRISFSLAIRRPFILGILLIILAPLTIVFAEAPLGLTPITLGGIILALASYIIHIYAYLDLSSEIKEEKLEIIAALYGILLVLGVIVLPIAGEALNLSWRVLSFLSSSRRAIWGFVIPDISTLILILITLLASEPVSKSLIAGLSAIIIIEIISIITLIITIYKLVKISRRRV